MFTRFDKILNLVIEENTVLFKAFYEKLKVFGPPFVFPFRIIMLNSAAI